jgi:type I restriction enzyme S subunit
MIDGLKPYPEYKDSGVAWLGTIPKRWEQRALRTVSKLRTERNPGKLPLLSVFLDRGVIPYGEGGGQVHAPSLDLSNYQVVLPGDFVLNNQQAWRGSVGVSRHHGIISPAYIVLRLTAQLNPLYANYLMRCPRMVDQFVAASKGVGDIQRQIFWPFLRIVQVPLPDSDEQAAIVRFLDHANGRIERAIRAKRKLMALLNEQKQAIIHRAVTRGLDPSVPLKPSGIPWLGDIPKHWEVWPLRRCISIASGDFADGTRIKSSRSKSHAFPVIGGNGIMGFTDQSNATETTIVIGRVGALCGNVHLVQESAWITDNALRITRIRGFAAEYLAEQLRDMNLNRFANANAQPLITGGTIKSQRVVKPPVQEQSEIVTRLHELSGPTNTALARTEREIGLLREYRTRLIADVVTGKLDVRAAARDLPAEPETAVAAEDLPDEAELETEIVGANDE